MFTCQNCKSISHIATGTGCPCCGYCSPAITTHPDTFVNPNDPLEKLPSVFEYSGELTRNQRLWIDRAIRIERHRDNLLCELAKERESPVVGKFKGRAKMIDPELKNQPTTEETE